jgi:hypothetical protein
MKPKPFSELNHLTVPVAMLDFLHGSLGGSASRNTVPATHMDEPMGDRWQGQQLASKAEVAEAAWHQLGRKGPKG